MFINAYVLCVYMRAFVFPNCVRACVRACVYVCVCVRERERESVCVTACLSVVLVIVNMYIISTDINFVHPCIILIPPFARSLTWADGLVQ